jgi:acyl-CoA synthetase (AMP-forming)/AMP-acid ligase II
LAFFESHFVFVYVFRYIFIAGAFAYQVGLKYSDRFYTPLPLYHTAAGIMCIGQSLLYGCSTVIRKKFSASGYFQDISKHNCTVSYYNHAVLSYSMSLCTFLFSFSYSLFSFVVLILLVLGNNEFIHNII